MLNDCGHYVPAESVTLATKKEDALVKALAKEFTAASEQLQQLKQDADGLISQFNEEIGALEGIDNPNQDLPDYRVLYSFDGKYKAEQDVYKHKAFNDKLRRAYQLMMRCVETWSHNVPPELAALSKQRVDFNRMTMAEKNHLLALAGIPSDNKDFKEAQVLLLQCQEIKHKKPRLRLYERDENGIYQLIVVNFSSIKTR